ncbi:YisB protein [Apiospora saccharicola]|uniref:YisB protein n=1 Tax=Apiospora saccharicola TaxID=335842 RepID=A0ABR1U2G8_9PEZI
MAVESDPEQDYQKNFDVFRDCLATILIEKVSQPQPKARRRAKATSSRPAPASAAAATRPITVVDGTSGSSKSEKLHSAAHDSTDSGDTATTAEDLADFIDYIATELYTSLPPDLQTLDHPLWKQDQKDDGPLQSRYALPLTSHDVSSNILLPNLDPSVAESLHAYGLLPDGTADDLSTLLAPALTSLLETVTAVPPPPSASKQAAQEAGCELCGRDWVPLTYHHLIPRFVHAKAVKRGWHKPEDLQNVAWLCAACHRAVHRFASHEDLARYYYTVDRLLEQDEIVQFAKWVAKMRWKGR